MLIRNDDKESVCVCLRVDSVVVPAPQPVLDFLWDVPTSRWDVNKTHNVLEWFYPARSKQKTESAVDVQKNCVCEEVCATFSPSSFPSNLTLLFCNQVDPRHQPGWVWRRRSVGDYGDHRRARDEPQLQRAGSEGKSQIYADLRFNEILF